MGQQKKTALICTTLYYNDNHKAPYNNMLSVTIILFYQQLHYLPLKYLYKTFMLKLDFIFSSMQIIRYKWFFPLKLRNKQTGGPCRN